MVGTATNDVTEFARRLLTQGIELLVRNNRLFVWPARAYRHLTEADRDFIKQHRAELKALAVSKLLPETTVTWSPHRAVPTGARTTPTHESTTRANERRSFPGITV